MVKIKGLTSDKGVTSIEVLEINGTPSAICGEIGCIIKMLLDKVYKDEDDKMIAKFTISTNLMDM